MRKLLPQCKIKASSRETLCPQGRVLGLQDNCGSPVNLCMHFFPFSNGNFGQSDFAPTIIYSPSCIIFGVGVRNGLPVKKSHTCNSWKILLGTTQRLLHFEAESDSMGFGSYL